MSPLPEWHSLVVAAVDGEISVTDRKKLREILKTNKKARQLLKEYREQAHLLSQAQCPPLPCDFASVFRNEPGFQNTDGQPNPKPKIHQSGKGLSSHSFTLATFVALALSLLLILGVGFSLFTRSRNDSSALDSKSVPNSTNPPIQSLAGGQTASAKLRSGILESDKISKQSASGQNNKNLPAQMNENLAAEKLPFSPSDTKSAVVADNGKTTQRTEKAIGLNEDQNSGESVQSNLLTAPYSNPGTLIESKISVPTWISWENPRLEWNANSASKTILLEIPCNDTMAVSGQIIQILKNQKKGILVDKLAQDRLIQKNIRTHFGICLENMNLVDVEKMLVSLKKDVENLKNKTAIPPLGKGIALFPPDSELPTVLQFPTNHESMDKPINQLSDLAPNPNFAKSPAKANDALKKLLLPTLNIQGKVDALVLAQSPYYPEVRSSSSSQEISLYRKLKTSLDTKGYRVIIFLRQLHI